MISTVVREFKWTPETIDGLYLDGVDHFGLQHWYSDIVEMLKEIETKKEK